MDQRTKNEENVEQFAAYTGAQFMSEWNEW